MREVFTDYYPFGSPLPGRSFNSNDYRYGFNGMEKDDEITGVIGSHTTAMFWEYDTRLGKRWNLDPKPNVSISQYAAFANNPIWFSDPLGDTLFQDKAGTTKDDLKLIAGKYANLLSFNSNTGEVTLDWYNAPQKARKSKKKFDKYKEKALKSSDGGFLNALITDTEVFYYGTKSTRVSILDMDKNIIRNDVLFPGTSAITYNNKDWFLQLNKSDYSASKRGFAPGNSKYSAMTFILPGTAYAGGVDGNGFKVIISRYKVVRHELNEAYKRVHGMYYEEAHGDYPILEFKYFERDL